MPSLTGVIEQPKLDMNRGEAGSISKDLSRFDTRRRVRDAYSVGAIPRVGAAAKTAAKSRAIAAPRISAFALLVYVTIVALLLMMVYSYMQLNEITIKTSQTQKELTELKKDEIKLKSNIEKRLNLKLIEERAIALGMTKPEREQIIYLDMSGGDRAQVLDGKSESPAIFSTISTGLAALKDFLS